MEIKNNICKKLAMARENLQSKELKKSGKNNYSGFEYYELRDFLPGINLINNEIGLISLFSISETEAILTIRDTDNDDILEFKTPRVDAKMKGADPIQCLGATHTYLKRYLYLNAYEIVENDIVDSLKKEEFVKTNSSKLIYSKENALKLISEQDEETRNNIINFYKVFEIGEIEEEGLKKLFKKYNK